MLYILDDIKPDERHCSESAKAREMQPLNSHTEKCSLPTTSTNIGVPDIVNTEKAAAKCNGKHVTYALPLKCDVLEVV